MGDEEERTKQKLCHFRRPFVSGFLLSALASCSPAAAVAAVFLAFFTPILRPDLFSKSWRSFGTLRRLG